MAGGDAAGSPAPPAPGERLRHLLHSITFGCLALLLIVVIFSLVMPFKDRAGILVLQILACALSITALLLVSWLFLAAADQREFQSLGLSFHPGWIRQLLAGLGAGAALMGVVIGAMAAAHLAQYSGVVLQAGPSAASFVATAVFIFLAAALEEIGFRGYAFQRLIEATSVPSAVAITSILFGLGHFGNPSATFLSTANTILAGIVMALAYLRTRGLWYPIGLHFAWNFFLGPIASLPVSGIRLGKALFEVRIAGPIWMTGGDYGPEGSVILTLVCLAGIVVLAGAPEKLLPAGRKRT